MPRPRPAGRNVDSFGFKVLSSAFPVVVVAEPADVAGAPAEAGTGHHRGRRLASGESDKLLNPLLGVRPGLFGNDGQKVYAVEAEPGHVELTAPG